MPKKAKKAKDLRDTGPAIERFFDFDALWSQWDPIPVRVFGKVYEAPAEAPASVRLRLGALRAERGDDGDLVWADLAEISRLIFGDEAVDEWIARRITERQLIEVVGYIFSRYYAPVTPTEPAVQT